jgi:hypothetical protein
MHPEQSKRIKRNVEPKFWARIETRGAFVLADEFGAELVEWSIGVLG